MARIELFGLPIDALTMEETLDRIEEALATDRFHQHVVVNAAKIVQASQDVELAEIIARSDLVSADGMSVVWASKVLGCPLPERVSGIDLMDRLLARAAKSGYPVYFLGGRAEVVERVVEIERERHEGLVVAGWRDGYWAPEEEGGVVDRVLLAQPMILLVALSSPLKEQFIARHKSSWSMPFVMGVGGSFDVVAGVVTRAPKWMQQAGLEWLHRLSQEPRRMLKRYAVGNTRFVRLVWREWKNT